jgi:hypothetical protein
VDRTPLEKLLLPALRDRLGAASSKARLEPQAQPDATNGAAVPAFGGFLAAPHYPAILGASCVVDPENCGVAVELTADFNKDGHPDIAVLQHDGTLDILTNDGTGKFSAPMAYSNPNVGSSSISAAYVADVNGDGYPEIVALDQGLNAIVVYLNKSGVFSTPTSTGIGASTFGGSLAVGDVNGDGIPDVVTATISIFSPYSLTVQTWIGNGDGTFKTPTTALTQAASLSLQTELPASLGVTLGDLNKDGKPDLAVDLEETSSNTAGLVVVTVALGNGDGSFGALNVNNPISIPVQGGGFVLGISSSGVHIVDLNGDGNADLAVDSYASDSPSMLTVALGDGTGHFTSTVTTTGAGGFSQSLYTDVNGDGIPDLLASGNYLGVWFGNGDGTFTHQLDGYNYVIDSGGAEQFAAADVNGDGAVDLAQLGGDFKQVSIFTGNGKGAFAGAPMLSSTTESGFAPASLDLANLIDVQGSGFSSPIFIDNNGPAAKIVTALNNGNAGFTYTVGLAAASVPTLGYIEPVKADFNGDGMQDLLIANTDGSVGVALSNGDGTFKTPVSIGLPTLSCEVGYAAVGDINGDGILDIAIAYPGNAFCGGSSGGGPPGGGGPGGGGPGGGGPRGGSAGASGYYVALGKGDGTFQTPTLTAFGTTLYAVTLADVNGDGILDLILNDEPTNATTATFGVSLALGNGSGTFASGVAVNTHNIVSQVIAGDYNGDGKTDLILLSEGDQGTSDTYSTAGVLLLPGNGDGSFGTPIQLGTGNFFANGQLADINNDGIPDIVLALYAVPAAPKTYYGLITLLGEGGGAFANPINTPIPLSSMLPLVGNLYNDNAPDVIIQSAYGPALFLGNGGTNLTLSGSASSIAFANSETFSFTIAGSLSSTTPTGTVSFYDGSTLLGSETLGNSGAATFESSTLPVGSHSITAVYGGDENFNPATSSSVAVTVTALAPAFTLGANPASATVSQGQSAIATLTLTANETFSGSINLTCSGAPANASCTVNPTSITLTPGGQQSATLVITTTATSAALKIPAVPGANPAPLLALAALVGLFGGLRSRRRFLMIVSLMVLTVCGVALTACGNSSPVSAVAKGNYSIVVTATPSGSSSSAQSTTVQITVN